VTETTHKRSLAPATIAVKSGFHSKPGEGIVPPIHVASTYNLPGEAVPGAMTYGRGENPAFAQIERPLTELEHGVDTVAFNAGVSAAVAIFDEVVPGQALVLPNDIYFGFAVYARDVLAKRGVDVRFVDMADLGAVEQAIAGATFLWTETPTNPHLTLVDLAAIGKLAASHGVPWACDNTFASPLLQHPLDHGAVASMHSATKYIGGHSDVIMGVAIVADAALATRLRKRRSQTGTQPNGFSCWLARRGLQTLPLRVRQQSASAFELATRLSTHPNVENVFYPGLPNHLDHDIAARQMHGGFGGMFSFIVKGGQERAQAVIDHCHVWTPATSLGGVESLIERRAKWTGEVAGPALLRCSTGIEDVEDLWDDLRSGLESRD
jgi:cystathionine gamma-synthase